MKIFITGGSGLLGQYLNLALSRKHGILTQYNSIPGNCVKFNSIRMDITESRKLEEIFDEFRPDVVVHLAAVSNAEKADTMAADLVYDINVNSTVKIAELSSRYGAKLIYTSTDLVYAGYRGSYLKEDAKLIPMSLYAETKLMAEVKIRQTFENYVVLREALLIGTGLNHTSNNFHKMFSSLKENIPVKLFTDQYRSPLALHDSVRLISELIEKNISGEIINWGGSSRYSRFQIGELLCEESGLDKNLLIPTTMEEEGLIYQVADVSMNNEKMKSFGLIPEELAESIRKIVNDN